jgi:hypothetical protein
MGWFGKDRISKYCLVLSFWYISPMRRSIKENIYLHLQKNSLKYSALLLYSFWWLFA